jgi:hypothetical protein
VESIGKTSNAIKDEWKSKNYTRISLYLPKADAEAYKRKCAEQSKALSDVPREAIYKFLGDA